MEDRQLIQEYVTHHSEAAFCSLVNRYIHLVHGVAVRQTPDPQLADDVTQVVFILLARKAATLSTRVILSGWLYQTARFVARRAARSELRRRRYEQEAFQMREISSPEETWRRLAPFARRSDG
jgi:DNA-directed RNA polymerase specialized sigma24 family protein